MCVGTHASFTCYSMRYAIMHRDNNYIQQHRNRLLLNRCGVHHGACVCLFVYMTKCANYLQFRKKKINMKTD